MKNLLRVASGIVFTLLVASGLLTAQEKNLAQAGVLNGKALKLATPNYPPAARAVKASGLVTVQVIVDEEGNVISANSLSGHPLLKQAAEEAAKKSQFSPTKLAGKTVKVSGLVVFNFAMENRSAHSTDKPKSRIYQIEQEIAEKDILNDKALRLPAPDYPAAAKAVGAKGYVLVKIDLDDDGKVKTAEIIAGHPLLKQAAINAAESAKFDPQILKKENISTGYLIYSF